MLSLSGAVAPWGVGMDASEFKGLLLRYDELKLALVQAESEFRGVLEAKAKDFQSGKAHAYTAVAVRNANQKLIDIEAQLDAVRDELVTTGWSVA